MSGGSSLYLDFETGVYAVPDPDIVDEGEVEAGPPPPVLPVEPTLSYRASIEEAANIVRLACTLLMEMPKQQVGRYETPKPPVDRRASDLNAACNYMRVFANSMVATSDEFAIRFGDCFTLAFNAGASLTDFENARRKLMAEAPISVIGIAVKQAAIRFCLEMEALSTSNMTFVSREDVEKVQNLMRESFAEGTESAADDMEQEVYQALAALASAVQFQLYGTARPLPRIVRYKFARTAPTLIYAYRLYQDAARGDELRAENKNVHPAFCKRTGRALSA